MLVVVVVIFTEYGCVNLFLCKKECFSKFDRIPFVNIGFRSTQHRSSNLKPGNNVPYRGNVSLSSTHLSTPTYKTLCERGDLPPYFHGLYLRLYFHLHLYCHPYFSNLKELYSE